MTREKALAVRDAHYIDHAPAIGGRTIPFERCEADICIEACEVLSPDEETDSSSS